MAKKRSPRINKRCKDKWEISDDIIFRQLEKDDGILLNLNTKNYYSLNETACMIVNSIKRGQSHETILKNIKSKFRVSPKTAKQDLDKTIAHLLSEKIII